MSTEARYIKRIELENARLRKEVKRLTDEINHPHTEDFFAAVKLEAIHQRERWGTDHDAGKMDQDWFWLVGYLAGKVLHPGTYKDKQLHRIIAAAAVLLNWHAYKSDVNMMMRPGIDPQSK